MQPFEIIINQTGPLYLALLAISHTRPCFHQHQLIRSAKIFMGFNLIVTILFTVKLNFKDHRVQEGVRCVEDIVKSRIY